MEKLKFFKGLFFGLTMSAAMWGGIAYTVINVDKTKFQPEVSETEINEPFAAKLPLAIIY